MWTPETLAEKMEWNYGLLESSLDILSDLDLQLYDAQAELTRVREWHRLNDDPAALGKNEAQRAAALAEKCKGEGAIVFNLERSRMEKRADMDRVRARIEHLRTQLRILELAAGIRPKA